MLRVPLAPSRRRTLFGALLVVAAVTLAGCGAPPDLTRPRGDPVPSPSHTVTPSAPVGTPAPTGQPTAPGGPNVPVATPTTPGFGEFTAVECAGRPSGSQLISFLRRTTRLLPSGGQVTVTSGPLCAGDWQYTVLQPRGYEPLQVVSTGAPSNLKLVTAGTNVCNAEVRATAPYGIRAVACEGSAVGPLSGP